MKKLLILFIFLPILAVGQNDVERIAATKASWDELIQDIKSMGVHITNPSIYDTIPVIMLVCDTSRQDSGFRTVTLYQDTNCDLIFHHISDSILTDLLLRSSIGKSKPVKSWDIIYQYDYTVFWMKGYEVVISGLGENGLLTREELFNTFIYLNENKQPVKYLVWMSKEVKQWD